MPPRRKTKDLSDSEDNDLESDSEELSGSDDELNSDEVSDSDEASNSDDDLLFENEEEIVYLDGEDAYEDDDSEEEEEEDMSLQALKPRKSKKQEPVINYYQQVQQYPVTTQFQQPQQFVFQQTPVQFQPQVTQVQQQIPVQFQPQVTQVQQTPVQFQQQISIQPQVTQVQQQTPVQFQPQVTQVQQQLQIQPQFPQVTQVQQQFPVQQQVSIQPQAQQFPVQQVSIQPQAQQIQQQFPQVQQQVSIQPQIQQVQQITSTAKDEPALIQTFFDFKPWNIMFILWKNNIIMRFPKDSLNPYSEYFERFKGLFYPDYEGGSAWLISSYKQKDLIEMVENIVTGRLPPPSQLKVPEPQTLTLTSTVPVAAPATPVVSEIRANLIDQVQDKAPLPRKKAEKKEEIVAPSTIISTLMSTAALTSVSPLQTPLATKAVTTSLAQDIQNAAYSPTVKDAGETQTRYERRMYYYNILISGRGKVAGPLAPEYADALSRMKINMEYDSIGYNPAQVQILQTYLGV